MEFHRGFRYFDPGICLSAFNPWTSSLDFRRTSPDVWFRLLGFPLGVGLGLMYYPWKPFSGIWDFIPRKMGFALPANSRRSAEISPWPGFRSTTSRPGFSPGLNHALVSPRQRRPGPVRPGAVPLAFIRLLIRSHSELTWASGNLVKTMPAQVLPPSGLLVKRTCSKNFTA